MKKVWLKNKGKQESPAREYLEQVKCCKDTDETWFFFALKSGEREEYKSTFRTEVKATEWAFDRINEVFEQVAKDEARKLSTVQENMIRSTDYLRRIIAPAGEQGGVTVSFLCPHCNSFPMEDNVWRVSGGKSTRIGGVRSVERSMTGSNRTDSCWCKQAKVFARLRFSERMQCLRTYAGI